MKTLHRRLWPAALAALVYAGACPASEPLAPLLGCRTLADPAARLACFDRESARLAPAATASSAPVQGATVASASAPPPAAASPGVAAVPAVAPPVAAAAVASGAAVTAAPPASVAPPATAAAAPAIDPKQNFGLSEAALAQKEVAAGARPKEISRIEAHITAISLTGAGLTTFTLDNGQVWRQLSPEGDLLAKPGDSITVSRGVLRSYWLQAKTGRGCKVTRIT